MSIFGNLELRIAVNWRTLIFEDTYPSGNEDFQASSNSHLHWEMKYLPLLTSLLGDIFSTLNSGGEGGTRGGHPKRD